MPRCPNCQYELEDWASSDPCPECGLVPREFTYSFFTPFQRSVVVIVAIAFPVAHLVLRYASSYLSSNIVWADLLLLFCLAVILLCPPLLVYLTKDRFDRGLARRVAIALAVLSLIPSCLLNVLIQSILW